MEPFLAKSNYSLPATILAKPYALDSSKTNEKLSAAEVIKYRSITVKWF